MINLLTQPLPYEKIRIGLTFLFLFISSYFDIFNNKNIPDKFLYFIVGVAFILSFVLFPFDIFVYALIQSLIVGGITYLMYVKGHIGEAEVFLFSSISMIFPYPPKITNLFIGLPFIIPVIIFSGLLFALTMFIYAFLKIGIKRIDIKHIILLVVYILFIIYMLMQSLHIFSLPFIFIISILFITSLYFSSHKKEIENLMVGEVAIDESLEEIVALDYETEEVRKLFKEPVIKKSHIKKLKEKGLKVIKVYKHLPPFIPFLTAGFLLALMFSNILLPF